MIDESNVKVAAGGVVVDAASNRFLLVHRPRYDDWSFPKGGLKSGEQIEQAALREVEEETGLRCRIIKPLSQTRYTYRSKAGNRKPKVVYYFLMEIVSGEIAVSGDEVDRVLWADEAQTLALLSYQHDRELLAEALQRMAAPNKPSKRLAT
jgi:8-oxo-dGTP pyrophosphatase MutT (NUDIX family)